VTAQGAFAALARDGGRGALVTDLSSGARLLVGADGSRVGTLGDELQDDAAVASAHELMWAERSERRADLFFDVVFPPPRVIAFGAVDMAAALCRVARVCGWRAFVVDPRARFAYAERFPDAEEVVAAWPEAALERLGGADPATAIAVLTHDPKLDDAALVLALRSDAGYIGAMGSRKAQAKRRERLLALGVEEAALERIAAPIGLDIGGLGAEETALSIMAEIVAVRRGRAGGRLAHASGSIRT
jgi:xanthine dehydrogenase accessory factor